MPHAAPPELIDSIKQKLDKALKPETVLIRDDSRKHAKHREAAGRYHLSIHVVSDCFRDLSPIERHRLVYRTLEEELRGPLHALRLTTGIPGRQPANSAEN